MNPFFKALIGIVIVAVIAGVGIVSQYKLTPAEKVGLSQEEMGIFADKILGFRDKAALANDEKARKDFLEKLGQQLSLVAEGQRRGLNQTDEAKALEEFTAAQVLQAAYFEAHPELAAGAQRGGAPPAPKEEVDAWVKAHADDVARYQQAIQSVSKGAPAPKPEEFASAFVFADKARAEGLENTPETRLQLKLARYGLLYQQMDAKLEEETKYSDDEVTKFYNDNKASGSLDQVHLQHILFATVPLGPSAGAPIDPEAKRQLAEQVLARVKAGEDFAALATEFSDDPGSKVKGGDLDWSARYKFVPDFEEAAWKLQPGQVTDLVKTEFGYHIIKMLERKAPDDLTPQTIEDLKDSLSQRRFEEKVKEIAKRNPVDLPQDFTVTAPEMPQMPMIPGMDGGVPPEMDPHGSPHGDPHGAPPPPPSSKGEGKAPAAKAPAPAKKGQ